MGEVKARLAAQIRAWALNNQIGVISVMTTPKTEEKK
jgi:hypothetical protein